MIGVMVKGGAGVEKSSKLKSDRLRKDQAKFVEVRAEVSSLHLLRTSKVLRGKVR